MKLTQFPSSEKAPLGGVGQTIHSLEKLLSSKYQFTSNGDIVISHANTIAPVPTDILWTHGLYPTGSYNWGISFDNVNEQILKIAANSYSVVSVSEWGGKLLEHQSGIVPTVIHNGIFFDDFKRTGDPKGFILWPKTTVNPVCDPTPAKYLYQKLGNVKTFAKTNFALPCINQVPHSQMSQIYSETSILLATTKENDSFAIMEAMASGIPVLGFSWGMTKEKLSHKKGCYLVEPYDYESLLYGYEYLLSNWKTQSLLARDWATTFDWKYQLPLIEELLEKTLQKKTSPKSVSIIIPSYNYSKYLPSAIESALAQTIPCEVIVVDDKSTDNSLQVANQYPIKVLQMEKNSGVSKTRNAGLSVSKGTHIIFLDADDVLEPDFAKITLDKFRKPEDAVVFTPIQVCSENLKFLGYNWFTEPFSLNFQKNGKNTCPSCAMISKRWFEIADGFDPTLNGTEDANLWLKIGLRRGNFIKASSLPLMKYRKHTKSLSENNHEKWHLFSSTQPRDFKFSVVLDFFDANIVWTILTQLPQASIHILNNPTGKYSSPILSKWVIWNPSILKDAKWKNL